jgi:hypothetical protein
MPEPFGQTAVEQEADRQVRKAASQRWRELASLPEAKGKERTAIALADHTECTIEEARRVLRSAPLDDQG